MIATLKPRLVKLKISPGQRATDRDRRGAAYHYVVKIDIGAETGLIAPLVGSGRQTRTSGFVRRAGSSRPRTDVPRWADLATGWSVSLAHTPAGPITTG
jgi:hypothetical protein